MANLGKREKIILAVTAILILYAAYDYLGPKMTGKAEEATQKTAELNSFVTDITTGAGKDLSKNLAPLIFSRAEREWTPDPFLEARILRLRNETKAPPKGVPAAAASKIEFVYTGYLEVDRQRMAIINGVEYREGENLDIKGFVLNTVSPTRVVVENRAAGTQLNIPLQE